MFRADTNGGCTMFGSLGSFNLVHLGRTDEARHKLVDRRVIQIKRAADLFDYTSAQHDDLVGHCHGFDLIVCHVDHCGLKFCVKLHDLEAHADAQRSVKVGQRFVKQKCCRFAHNRTANGHTLALAT